MYKNHAAMLAPMINRDVPHKQRETKPPIKKLRNPVKQFKPTRANINKAITTGINLTMNFANLKQSLNCNQKIKRPGITKNENNTTGLTKNIELKNSIILIPP